MTQQRTALLVALEANPQQPGLWYRAAQHESQRGDFAGAAALLREGLRHCPDQPDLLYLLANSLHHAGALADAVAAYRRCAQLAPHITEALIELPLALLRMGAFAQAETAAREAVDAAPRNTDAHINLGTVLCRRHRYIEGLAALTHAMALAPDSARACNQAALAQQQLGKSAQAVLLFERALALQPGYALARSNLALARLYVPDVRNSARQGTHASLLECALPGEKRRVGFVSADLRQHVVALFLLPLFAHRDRALLEFHVYSVTEESDSYTATLQHHADAWTDARGLTDAALAAKIAADRIDVLIDLNGHTAGNRLPLFALRPAPAQASWLGFPGVVNMPGIDYRITDGVLDPPGTDDGVAEIPVRLPHAFFCYAPPAAWGGTLESGAPTTARGGPVRFGAFNDMAKLSDACVATWAAVLKTVPGAQLIWRARCFEEPAARERWHARLAALGVVQDRVRLLAHESDPARHMAIWREIDIHLDTFPYTGGTTTCDALWHGVPVVTLAGARPSERLAASVLTCIGCEEWIASNVADYVQIAARLANNATALTRWRASLRETFKASPLYDGASFAHAFGQACEAMLTRSRAGC